MTRRKDLEMLEPRQDYDNDNSPALLVLFNRRYPGVAERFHSEWEAWGEGADDVEYIDANHVVLVIRPGGARRLGMAMRDRDEGGM
jgi:hypothetical protein